METPTPWRRAAALRVRPLLWKRAISRARCLDEVRRLRRSVRSDFPNDAPILVAIGDAFCDLGRYEDGLAAFEQALRAEPGVASYYLRTAQASRGARDNAKAIQYLEKVLEADPLIQEAYGELVAIYEAQGREDQVRRTWERFVAVFPTSIEAREQLRRLELSAK